MAKSEIKTTKKVNQILAQFICMPFKTDKIQGNLQNADKIMHLYYISKELNIVFT